MPSASLFLNVSCQAVHAREKCITIILSCGFSW